MQALPWLPEPPEGTKVCLGFDGSETSDFTVIKAETIDGLLFTPRWNCLLYTSPSPRDS